MLVIELHLWLRKRHCRHIWFEKQLQPLHGCFGQHDAARYGVDVVHIGQRVATCKAKIFFGMSWPHWGEINEKATSGTLFIHNDVCVA